ncbi:FAD-binding oxidoreductase [Actinoplanes sp. DH11]|uniref:NAD(P)/FAD-dependent oxidoreductase n=1 Tax=Actinoplanes sp. DH11 TaxID=2857011 RepID=UPI001E3552C2|nr:FAD-dependent oxidoreductase [Actinoplanes sp. DH11]
MNRQSLSDVSYSTYWLADPGRPAARGPLTGELAADLVVIGGGYTGLWTAIIAKERDPRREVVLIEGGRIGHAASGRNGGFVAASLTHGFANGYSRWPEEIAELERLGLENLQGIEDTIERYGIDCEWERTGALDVATEPHQIDALRQGVELARQHGVGVEFLDGAAVRAEIGSPRFLAGAYDRRGTALVNPAKLAWGLAEAAEKLGVHIFEGTFATGLARDGAGMQVRTSMGRIRARHVALGTNVYPSLVKRARLFTIPVYDYALMTEPLTAEQRAAIGWEKRQGLSDSGNQFHYFRQTADNRILWGGYDAIYHYGGKLDPSHEHRQETYHRLADHFFDTFPQLEGLKFSHAWGGAIDTCTRFAAFFGAAYGGRVAYAAGYTGLGVAATRFGADVMLDLLAGEPTARTRTRMVSSKPLPFPPEPVRWAGVELTRRSLIHADANGGRRNLWLKAMDAVGFGFDS